MAAGYDLIFFDNSDNTIILEQLKNKVTGLLIPDASITWEVFSDDPPTVSLLSGTFTAHATITGKYTGDIADSIAWSAGTTEP